MSQANFEALLIEYKAIEFDDNKWNEASDLLDRIADIHETDVEFYEPIMRKHKVSY